jgi:hypothetical protein
MAKVLDQTGGQVSRGPGGCPSEGAFSAKQSRRMSLVEAIANVAVGFAVALLTQIIVFPLFDLEVTIGENPAIGGLFILASIFRLSSAGCSKRSASAARCRRHGHRAGWCCTPTARSMPPPRTRARRRRPTAGCH